MQYNATTATIDVMSKFDYLQKFKRTYYFPSNNQVILARLSCESN